MAEPPFLLYYTKCAKKRTEKYVENTRYILNETCFFILLRYTKKWNILWCAFVHCFARIHLGRAQEYMQGIPQNE